MFGKKAKKAARPATRRVQRILARIEKKPRKRVFGGMLTRKELERKRAAKKPTKKPVVVAVKKTPAKKPVVAPQTTFLRCIQDAAEALKRGDQEGAKKAAEKAGEMIINVDVVPVPA